MSRQGMRFSRMFTQSMEHSSRSNSSIFESAFGWVNWSYHQKVLHSFSKYHAISATLRPSLQFSCQQKCVFFWAAFCGAILSQGIFFSGHSSSSKCEDRRAALNELEKLRLTFAVGLLSSLVSSTLLSTIKSVMRKEAQWAKGWDDSKKLQVLKSWRQKDRAMQALLIM